MEFKPYEVILLLLATIGPLKVTIVCATLTAGASPEFLKQVASRSVLIALTVCIVFAVLGEAILKVFHVSLPAFQIGGGIIMMLFSIEMAMENKADKKADQLPVEPSMDIAAYPLAVPLMASVSGLVAIVSLIAQMEHDLQGLLYVSGLIVLIMALNYACLRSSRFLVKALGPAALMVISKIMGVILVALSVELIYMGLLGFELVPKLG
ncbi:MAG: MarC family protein [Methylotetracoccus sp.]|jgi:multiple antibiotic resistance protein|nr:MarC family protein [Methylotetracoccus sp.]